MESLMDFAYDKSSKSVKQQVLKVSNKNDTILIGESNNPSLIAITFTNNTIKLDIDNSNHQFDSMVVASNSQTNNILTFDVEKIKINPDLTINLDIKNSSIKTLRLRPDEISRVNSKNLSSLVYSSNDLLNIDLPKNLFSHKDKIEGLEAFPSQFVGCLSQFDNTTVKDFTVNNKAYNIAKINDKYYVTDGDFLRQCEASKTNFFKEKEANTIQFNFNLSKKNLQNVSDDTFNEICSFINANANDPNQNLTKEKIEENQTQLKPSEDHVYYKDEKSPDGNILRFSNEKTKPTESQKEKLQEKKPEAKPESKIKTQSIDLAYPMKLVGLALFLMGFFGGPLLAMILGVCIGGSAYAFSSKLEEIKIPVGEKPPRKKYIYKKQKPQIEKLSERDIVEKRISTLNSHIDKISAWDVNHSHIRSEKQKKLANLQADLTNASTPEEQLEIQNQIDLTNLELKKLYQLKQDYEDQASVYAKLIANSLGDLNKIVDTINQSPQDLQNQFEASYEKTIEEQNLTNQILQNIRTLTDNLSNATSYQDQQNYAKLIDEEKIKYTTQKQAYEISANETDNLKLKYNTCLESKNIFAENMDSSVVYKNIENGMKILENINNEVVTNFTEQTNNKRKNKFLNFTK